MHRPQRDMQLGAKAGLLSSSPPPDQAGSRAGPDCEGPRSARRRPRGRLFSRSAARASSATSARPGTDRLGRESIGKVGMDEALQVHLEQSGDVPVVRVVGEVDLATAPGLRDRLAEVPAGARKVVVDLSAVTFLDSSGLSVLVATWKRFCGAGPDSCLRLVVTRPAIQRVLEVTGLAHVFVVFPTVEQAVQG